MSHTNLLVFELLFYLFNLIESFQANIYFALLAQLCCDTQETFCVFATKTLLKLQCTSLHSVYVSFTNIILLRLSFLLLLFLFLCVSFPFAHCSPLSFIHKIDCSTTYFPDLTKIPRSTQKH